MDARIFHKEAKSLARAGHEVRIMGPCQAGGVFDGISIEPTKRYRQALWLVGWVPLAMRAIQAQADAYHLHDPNLLLAAWLIRVATRKHVIYDAHEWNADAVLFRSWLPPWSTMWLSRVIAWLEPWLAKRLTAVVTADDGTAVEFRARGLRNVRVIHNYPLLDLVEGQPPPAERDRSMLSMVWIGAVGAERGIFLMLQTVALLRHQYGIATRLTIVGPIHVKGLSERVREEIGALDIASSVELVGRVPHDELAKYLAEPAIGLLILSAKRFERNIPVKMFEYMLAGLPIVGTRSATTWRYAGEAGAAMLLESGNASDYAQAIAELWADPERQAAMGAAGRAAVLDAYNWDREAEQLVDLYASLDAPQG